MRLATSTPATVVVTASGDLGRADFDMTDPDLSVILLSTTAGARRLRSLRRPERVEIVDLGDRRSVPVESVLGFLRDRGLEVVLSEGGPTLFGELPAANAVDDLFLTVAPQVAGRSERPSASASSRHGIFAGSRAVGPPPERDALRRPPVPSI